MATTTLSDVRYYHDMGFSVLEISGYTGMKRPLIYYWLGQWGITPNITRRPVLTTRQQNHIAKLADKGLSQADIARAVGVPVHQVRYEMARVTE